MKKKKIKTRFYNYWRCDSSKDYGDKLSEEDREWLEAFEREYYGGEPCKHDIHPEEYKKSLHDAQNEGQRDLFTASTEQKKEAVEQVHKAYSNCKKPTEMTRYYHPEDWLPGDLEDFEYLEFIRIRCK